MEATILEVNGKGTKFTTSNMQRIIVIIAVISAPFFVGLENNRNAIIVCQNFTDRTDADIENVLAVYNLENDCMSEPNFMQLYKSGLKTIFNH